MKALSIKQPWASLIAHGVKNIENRTWKTNFRGRIYIHASAKWVAKPEPFHSSHRMVFSDLQWSEIRQKHSYLMGRLLQENAWHKPHKLSVSAIIGEVDIVDCVINHESIWAEKSEFSPYQEDGVANEGMKPIYNWVLANALFYDKPILNVKGKLSLWEFEKEHLE